MIPLDSDHIEAPFTDEQVATLNDYQKAGVMHPFTCGRRDDSHPFEGEYGDSGCLRATPAGWVCVSCDYTQNWAWAFMADRSQWPSTDWRDGLGPVP